MVKLNIVCYNKVQAKEIIDLLVKEKYIIDAMTVPTEFYTSDGSVNESAVLVMAKTKALLFNSIDELIRDKYPHTMPELFSTAIVNMDWEQSDRIVKLTAKV